MHPSIHSALETKDKNTLSQALIDFRQSHNDEQLLQELSEIVSTSVVQNEIKPIQVVMHYYNYNDDILKQFKNHIADEIVQHNKHDLIDKSILGGVTGIEELFSQTIHQENIPILNFLVNHELIEIKPEWIPEIQIYVYSTNNKEFIDYVDKLFIQAGYKIEKDILLEMFKKAFLIQSIDNIEHIEKRASFKINQLDIHEIRTLISFATQKDPIYNNSIEQQQAFLEFIEKNKLQPRYYLTSLIDKGIKKQKNPLLLAQIAHYVLEKKIDNITVDEMNAMFELKDQKGNYKEVFNMLKEKSYFENTMTSFDKSKRKLYQQECASSLPKKMKI